MLDIIVNKSIMRHHARGFQQPVLTIVYFAEEEKFMKTAYVIHN